MGIFSIFKTPQDNSAAIAAGRLKVLVDYERDARNRSASQPDFFPLMRDELVEAVSTILRKYSKIDERQINIDIEDNDNGSKLSLSFPIN